MKEKPNKNTFCSKTSSDTFCSKKKLYGTKGVIVPFLTAVLIIIALAVLLIVSIIIFVFANEADIKYSANIVHTQTVPYNFLDVLLAQQVNDKNFAEAATMYTAVGYGKRFDDFAEMRYSVKALTRDYGIDEYNIEAEKDGEIIFRVMKVPEFCGMPGETIGYCKDNCALGQEECKEGDDKCLADKCQKSEVCCVEKYTDGEYEINDGKKKCGKNLEGICESRKGCSDGRKTIDKTETDCEYVTTPTVLKDVEKVELGGICCAPMTFDEITSVEIGQDGGTAAVPFWFAGYHSVMTATIKK